MWLHGTHSTTWYQIITVCTSASSVFAAKFRIYVLQSYVFFRPSHTRPILPSPMHPTKYMLTNYFVLLSITITHFSFSLCNGVVITEKIPLL